MSNENNHIGPLENPEMKKNIFQVPDGYFDRLEEEVRDRMAAEDGELAENEHLKESVFEIPEGYFDQLEDRINAKVAEESDSLSKEDRLKAPVFEVPTGYFEGFESRLQERLAAEKQEEETQVIPLYQRNWFRLAIAALLVLGFFLLKPTPPEGMEALSDETIIAYLSESEINLDMMASLDLDGFDIAIDQILEEETADYDFGLELNPELDYEFEYFEQ